MSKLIGLRIQSPELEQRVRELSEEQGLSINMTVNMLLGYAFNEIDEQGKEFKKKVVFESESKTTEEERKLYELARKEGNKRFGSECQHTTVVGSHCTNCFRKVM